MANGYGTTYFPTTGGSDFMTPQVMPYSSPTAPSSGGPTFDDLLRRLNQPISTGSLPTMNAPSINPVSPINRSFGGGGYFQQGQDILSPDALFSPGTQRILDIIRQQGDVARTKGVSDAQALALRRGIQGSSTEQFGTQQAGAQAEQATLDSQTQVLLQNLQRQQAVKDLQARAYFDRATQDAQYGRDYNLQEYTTNADQAKTLATLGSQQQIANQGNVASLNGIQAQLANQRALQGAQLTSDEIASLRNTDFANRQLTMQGLLGQQGIDIARQNIGASQDIASQQARYGLIGSLGSAFIPALLGGGGGAGGGFLSGLGGGGTMANLFGGTATPFGSMLSGSSGAGAEGVPLAGAGGNGLFAAGPLMAGAGLGLLGGSLGTNVFGNGRNQNIGAAAGGVGGFLLGGPAGAGLGAFAGAGLGKAYGSLTDTQKAIFLPFLDPGNTAKQIGSGAAKVGNAVGNAAKSVGNAVSSIFPF